MIGIGFISYYFIYIFLTILANGIRVRMIMLLNAETQIPTLTLTLLFINSIAELLSGFPFIVSFIKTLKLKFKNQSIIKQQILMEQKLQFEVVSQKQTSNRIRVIFMIIVASLISFLSSVVDFHLILNYNYLDLFNFRS